MRGRGNPDPLAEAAGGGGADADALAVAEWLAVGNTCIGNVVAEPVAEVVAAVV